MTYLDPLAPSGNRALDLLFYPYHEGVRNLHVALCFCKESGENSPSLLGRVTHAVLGVLLLIPLINTVLFVVMRLFSPREKDQKLPHWASDRPENIIRESPPKLRPTCGENFPNRQKLQELNARRKELEKKIKGSTDDNKRSGYNKEIMDIEKEAVTLMKISTQRLYSSHLKATAIPLDGQLIGSKKPVHYKDGEKKTTTTLRQMPGLSQQNGENNLCGYYSLYFMLQAVTDGSFTDRKAAQPILKEWANLILQKRAASFLSTRRSVDLPEGITLHPAGITPDEINYLIEKAPSLAAVKNKIGCFILNMDDLNAAQDIEINEGFRNIMNPIELIGKSKELKQLPNSFPRYFIIKSESDSHYYFAFAKAKGDFTIVHSMNWSILDKNSEFRKKTFRKIVNALNQQDTFLRLS